MVLLIKIKIFKEMEMNIIGIRIRKIIIKIQIQTIGSIINNS
jgi:hypothetical protein